MFGIAMADDHNPSSEPPLHVDKSTTDDEEMVEDDADGEFDDDDDDDDVDGDGDLESTEAEIGKEMRSSEIETLAVPSCYLRAEVPKEYTLLRHESTELKSKVRGSHQEALASVIAQAAQAQVQNQLQSPATPPPLSSAPSPNTQELRLVPVMNSSSLCGAVANQQNASDHISVFSSPIIRRHATDGYNWRKYGQKQVKSPQGSRSYYRCTCAQCYAKKIECCDHSNLITEVIYKGEHNHGPPTKLNRGRESKAALSVTPISVISNRDQTAEALMDTDPSTSSNVVKQQDMPSLLELKRENSIDSDGDDLKEKEEHTDDLEPKRRAKKSSSPHYGSLPKTAKKPKLVVHTAGDMGISGDGYRWRKYGQKMVKGNPHPRNYYRCTSAGCPVRKHIERAVDRSTGLTITYKGVHDHEMPVAKKRHGTSNRLLAPTPAPVNNSQSPAPAPVNNSQSPAPASVNNSQSPPPAPAPASVNNSQSMKADTLSNQECPALRSVNTEGGLIGDALKVKGEKPVNSARTLLSVGFEIKPC